MKIIQIVGSTPLFYYMKAKNWYFSLLKHNFLNGTQTMQFYTVICCLLWHLPYFYSEHFGIINYGTPFKIGLGATIRQYCIILWNVQEICKESYI